MIGLSIGCLGVALPLPVSAAALSSWVQGVLDRAEAGRSVAAGLPGSQCTNGGASDLLDAVDDAVRTMAGSSIDTEETWTFLEAQTVCAEHDRRLLLRSLRTTAEAATLAASQCRPDATRALLSTLRFTADAYRSFLAGVDDPAVTDDRLRWRYPFETSARWSQGPFEPEADTASLAPLCPFTSDYGPPSLGLTRSTYAPLPVPTIASASYGCDLAVLRCIAPQAGAAAPTGCDPSITQNADASIKKEADRLATALETIDRAARPLADSVSVAMQALASIMEALTGARPPSSLSSAIPPPPHAVMAGCLRPPIPQTAGDDRAEDADRALLAFPQLMDREYLTRLGLDPERDSAHPPSAALMPWWLLLRGPATDLTTVRSFLLRREEAGAARPTSGAWSFQSSDAENPLAFVLGGELLSLAGQSGDIERATATLDLIGRDAMEMAEDSSTPFHEAVASLARVTEDFLPQQYLPSLTMFMLRSCSGGPCEARLRAVLKRTFNPYCHPFLSGKYREKDVPEKCFCTGVYASESYCAE